ncbi:substrate-binding domain-containing protein [Microbacterium horticulturae]|uniref:Substrate-binding domain-containing protein n=1 Tax=Microbacterium horticulturae TaxID=3028316 RepID=A0ABY8C0B7_9MICO|nr:substrate-binding domain-containing protein [Microbacterium sp. KACC 23027]WEG08506.1 substrate-binding domain-containing protein [Microbacterium sp. KACC 23027]
MRTARKITMAAAMVAIALTVSACTTDGGNAAKPSDSSSLSAAAQKALDTAYTGVGSTLEDLTPATPKSDINFYVMSCGQSLSTCAAPTAAMVDAAKTAGWKTTVVDGKLSPEGFATAIRQAVAGGADVLVPVGISCSAAAAAFKEAKNAGVVIVGGGGVDDCDPKEWNTDRLWLENPPVPTPFGTMGKLQADYTWGKTNGDLKAVVVNMTSNPWGSLVTSGYTDEVKALGSGEVVATVDISDPESADGSYIQKIVSVLLAHPDANALVMPTDAYLVNGLAAGVAQAGLADKLTVVGGFGSEAAIDMIRDGQPGITATIGQAQIWEAWGSVDTAIRVLDGKDPQYIGQSLQAVDADHNMPKSGPYDGSIDWKSKFLTAWGK